MVNRILLFLIKILNPLDWKDVIRQLFFFGMSGVIVLLLFFYVYLPFSTNHGEAITVPDVYGIPMDQLDEVLINRNLRYEINSDSGYNSALAPLTVLKQFPLPNSKVKENRKVYITLNALDAPLVNMPDLTNGSLKNALMILTTNDLKFGTSQYVPDLAFNAVLIKKFEGAEIKPGKKIPKGSIIDLIIGDGYGNSTLESPYLIGLGEEAAQLTITGSALKMGTIMYQSLDTTVLTEMDEEGIEIETKIAVKPCQVVKQHPAPGNPMVIKETVNIWIYQPDTTKRNP